MMKMTRECYIVEVMYYDFDGTVKIGREAKEGDFGRVRRRCYSRQEAEDVLKDRMKMYKVRRAEILKYTESWETIRLEDKVLAGKKEQVD